MKISKIKLTVIKKFSPQEILGYEIKQSSSGEVIVPCQFFEEGQEIIAENSFKMPDGFCGWAWRDLTVRFTKFNLVDEDWPETDVTYMACGDGLRPVIFKVERLD